MICTNFIHGNKPGNANSKTADKQVILLINETTHIILQKEGKYKLIHFL